MADLSTAEANRRFYAELAETYDATESCVVAPRQRARLRALLERALALAPPDPRVLDACGGSGNASLLLLELGAKPVTVDVSEEMLAIYRRKAEAAGYEPDTRLGEIEEFLGADGSEWDVVVFSSALHHLEDPVAVVELAAGRIAPGGVLVSIFDPTRTGRAGRIVRRVDYGLHVALHTPSRLPRLVVRRGSGQGADPVGAQAERHADAGIDDVALAERLRALGFEVTHERGYEMRYGVTRLGVRLLRAPSTFTLLAVRR
jgi:SAM-dependent methyltransferase